MINILSNAIKYNREHGAVTVVCEAGADGTVRIGVRDTGAGLDAAQLAQLFQPFNRLERDAGVEEGTGIGLALTRHLVQLMNGTISVDSAVDVGTVFWVAFARCEPIVAPAAPAGPASEAPRSRPSRTISTLLYIEDNPGSLRLVEQIVLPRTDLRLLSSPEGYTGIALARQHLPHVILVDINLPGIDGYEIRRLLRADPRTSRIPVIAVSANALASDVSRAKLAGFYCYLTKPIDIDEFSAAIDRALAAYARSDSHPRS
jgi:CheY-like chemotaxis protein